jgi:hypothetical protein
MIPKRSRTRAVLTEAVAQGSVEIDRAADKAKAAAAYHLAACGLLERKTVYTPTDAGRRALALADEPRAYRGGGISAGQHKATPDTSSIPASLPWWGKHPPVTDLDAIAQIEQEARGGCTYLDATR